MTIAINWGLPEGTPSYSHETIHGPNAVVYTQSNEQPYLNLGELSDKTVVVLRNGNGTRVIECESDDDGTLTTTWGKSTALKPTKHTSQVFTQLITKITTFLYKKRRHVQVCYGRSDTRKSWRCNRQSFKRVTYISIQS